jgi:hypothetical protein
MLDRMKALKLPATAAIRPSGRFVAPSEQQESNGRREAPRLVERKKLWRSKAYGRMRRETKPRGAGGMKPLRGCETLRAEGAGEVNRHVNDRLR